jgi:hypothetical protein
MQTELERLEEELSKVWSEAWDKARARSDSTEAKTEWDAYAVEADATVERIFGKLITVLEGKNND